MSLLIWLPLIKDGKNQGIMDITPTTLGTISFIQGGKIGKCLSAGNGTAVTNGISYNTNLTEIGNKFSISVWVKPLGNHVHYNGTIISSGNWDNSTWTFGVNQGNTKVDLFCRGYNTYMDCTIPTNIWTHLVCTNDNGTCKLYKNGVYVGSSSRTAGLVTDANNFCVGRETYANGYFSFNGNINDLRIYDEVLSLKEIKELSRGLSAHYKLDNIYNTSNLIINGNGEFGTENLRDPNCISTIEIPSGHSEIKASFKTSDTMFKEFIPIFSEHSYTISAYFKTGGAASGSIYPSIYPYDADKKLINYNMTPDSFLRASLTTLKQPLKKGDTIVYANDLSGWNTGTSNYYCCVAVFNYTDGHGTVFPELTYTRDTPAFGTYSDKSNIDKTNNKITLTAAYTGEDRPVGTPICQSCYGATYYYPFGGMNLINIQDWTFKTATITPALIGHIKYAAYIKYGNMYNTFYAAGVTLLDNTTSINTVEDSSGYNYTMTPVGTISCTSNTPRNSLSTHFINGSYFIANQNCTDYLPRDAITVNIWIKPTTWSNPISCTESGGWNIEELSSGGVQFSLLVSGVGYVHATSGLSSSTLKDGNWHMLTGTFDSNLSVIKIYIDGELKGSTNTGSTNGIRYASNRLIISGEARTTTPESSAFVGEESDVRIYATALSAEDIKELYNIGCSIDKSQKIHTCNYEEQDSGINKISKKGVSTTTLTENEDVHIKKSGIIEAHEFKED